jgi:lysine 6-dehydrogenase
MASSLTAYAMTLLDETDEIMIWDGGNPLHPKPPFNYILTFNIAGLTNEYYGVAHFLKDGKRVEVPTFQAENYETVDFPAPIGRMEAFVTGGGTSAMPWSFEGKLNTLWNKTLRWPGHFATWKGYMDAGLLRKHPLRFRASGFRRARSCRC